MSNVTINKFLTSNDWNQIVILGKGSSLDYIDNLQSFLSSPGKLVINLNDSFTIFNGDLTVVTNEKCRSNLRESVYPVIPNMVFSYAGLECENQIVAERFDEDELDPALLEGHLVSDSIRLHKYALISALSCCAFLTRRKGHNIKVYMLGIDFEGEYSKSATNNLLDDGTEYTKAVLNSQSDLFRLVLPILDQQGVKVKHIGTRKFSWMSPEAFSKLYDDSSEEAPNFENKNIINKINKINKTNSAVRGSTQIVAEITTNHFGDWERLEAMIIAAAKAGADFIKLQCRNYETFYTKEQLDSPYDSPFGSTFRDYRCALELTDADFLEVDKLTKRLGIKWFASVLDYSSYKRLVKLGLNMIKLPSTISEHRDFLVEVAENFKGSVVISTGYTDSDYEKFILDNFHKCRELYLLQCTSAYPTPDSDAEVAVVKHYSTLSHKYPNLKPGFSSHDVGSLGCQLAVACGAVMIEKHVKFGNVSWAHFDDVAIDLSDGSFDIFVADIRRAERLLGAGAKKVKPSEHHKYWVVSDGS